MISFWRTVILLFNLLLAYSSHKVSTLIKKKTGCYNLILNDNYKWKILMNELFLGLVVTLKQLINQNTPTVFQK